MSFVRGVRDTKMSRTSLALELCTVTGGRQAVQHLAAVLNPGRRFWPSRKSFGSRELTGGSPTCVNEGLTPKSV